MPGRSRWMWAVVAAALSSVGCCAMADRWCHRHSAACCQPCAPCCPTACAAPASQPMVCYPAPAGTVANAPPTTWSNPQPNCCR